MTKLLQTHDRSNGWQQRSVQVLEIHPDGFATCVDRMHYRDRYPMQYTAGGRLPQVGESWIIERDLGGAWCWKYQAHLLIGPNPWHSWNPLWLGPASPQLSDGTIPDTSISSCWYLSTTEDRTVKGHATFLWGTGGSSGPIKYCISTPPITPASRTIGLVPMACGSGILTRASNSSLPIHCDVAVTIISGSACFVFTVDASNNNGQGTNYVGASVPWLWGTAADSFSFSFLYEY